MLSLPSLNINFQIGYNVQALAEWALRLKVDTVTSIFQLYSVCTDEISVALLPFTLTQDYMTWKEIVFLIVWGKFGTVMTYLLLNFKEIILCYHLPQQESNTRK